MSIFQVVWSLKMSTNKKVLALKYRPQVFDDLIGQNIIVEAIKNGNRTLDLTHRNLRNVPTLLSRLDEIVEVQLAHNLLTSLPGSIGSMKNLQILRLQNCQLEELPETFGDLDNSLGSADGKKAVVGLSKYGIDINQKDYKLFVSDDDSLYTSDNPGNAGTITLNGKLKDANDLNAVVTIFCSTDESGNIFTVTGTNSSGTTITEQITGATATKDDSLFTSANPGAPGTITLNGSLKDSNNLNAVVTIFCSADESGNTFTVTGTNSSGTTITEQITGATATNTAVGSTKFTTITKIENSATASGNIKIGTIANTAVGSTKFATITKIETSATASGNIKIGTAGHNDVNDDDSLVQLTSFISGNPIEMNGVLSTSEYLGAKIQIKSREDTTGTTFIIAGIDLNNKIIEERILGSNGGVVTTNNIFKSVTSITSSGTNNGKIKIGTKAADGNWNTTIDANALNIDT